MPETQISAESVTYIEKIIRHFSFFLVKLYVRSLVNKIIECLEGENLMVKQHSVCLFVIVMSFFLT